MGVSDFKFQRLHLKLIGTKESFNTYCHTFNLKCISQDQNKSVLIKPSFTATAIATTTTQQQQQLQEDQQQQQQLQDQQ